MTVTKKNKHIIKCVLIISTTINLCGYNAWAYFNNEEKNTELDIPETRAIDVNAFLETLGICIHYAQGVDVRTYVEPLNYLGIKNIRDDLGKPQGYVFLRKQSGIKSAVIANSKDLSLTINSLKYMAREDALLAVEGPNEPNNFPIEYQGEFGGGFANLSKKPANWLPVANFQKDLYAAVKGEKIHRELSCVQRVRSGGANPKCWTSILRNTYSS